MYTRAGTFTVTLTAINDAGSDKATKSNYIVVTASNLPSPSDTPSPVAAFTASTTRGTAPATIKFTDQSTGAPTSWAWNFGDGNISALQSPYHMYTQAGTYTVTLTATNDAGSNKTTKSNYIIVAASNLPVAPPPIARFTASPISGNAPLTVKFTDTSTWSPTSWSWNFGDSKVSTDQDPTHIFAKAGNFTILLTARKGNISSTTSAQIVVSPTVVTAPAAALTASAPTGTKSKIKKNDSNNNNLKPACNVSKTVPTKLRVLWRGKAPHKVSFLDRSKRRVSWSWDFGDGNTSKYKNILHMYNTPGKYLVKLTDKTTGHCTKTIYVGYIVVEATSYKSPQ
jgi:PKD repeat protein